jgi:tetratricopeptide (TPR) repeat protein
MPEVSGFAEIAPYLTNPLVLAGFGLLLFFGLLHALLKSKVMPTVTQRTGGRAVLRGINYGFIVALVVIVLGFALAWWQTERATVDVDEILDDFRVATETAAVSQGKLEAIARLGEIQDSDAFRAAVVAIVRESKSPNAPRGIDRAIELLRQGETGAAETVLAEVLDRRLRERATASQEAAEAARHLGAIAYVNDTAKSIEAYRTATELDPEHTWSWIYLGRLYQRAGKLAAAEEAFKQARDVAERAGDARDVMVADGSLGDVRVATGDLAGALATYEATLATAQALAAQDPSVTEWQRDLSVSFNKIGDVQSARGNLDGALQAYQDGLEIAEKLAAQDPGNAGWQRDLSVSFDRIGDVQSARGNLDGALQAYQDGLAIREKLAAQDPGNAGWQRDLAISYGRIAIIDTFQGERERALAALRKGRAIIARLQAASPDHAILASDLAWFDAEIAKLAG